MAQNDTIKRAMIAALEKSLGVVTTACRAVDMSRETHYRWLREDAEYAKAVKDLEDVALDFAESKLHKLIEKGETAATIFYLKTKGKSRGYIERFDMTTNGDNLPPINIIMPKLDDE